MLISTAIFTVVAASIYLLYQSMLRTYTTGELRADVQQSARIALAQITQDLRGAGYDPSGAIASVSPGPQMALRAATPTCLSFVSYVAPGGSPASVQVSYRLNAGALERRVDSWSPGPPSGSFGGGSWADLTQRIASLQFTYYDEDGLVVANNGTEPPAGLCPPASSGSPPPGQLSVEQMHRVRRVEVVVRAEATASGLPSAEVFVLGNNVQLRNR
jgi:type II secretory pathway component PulJ